MVAPIHEIDGRPAVIDDAEANVLGAMMLDPVVVERVGTLSVSDFHSPKHQAVYAAIVAAHADHGATDPISVMPHVAPGRGIEMADLMDLAESVVSPAAIEHHAQLVRETARRRRIAELGREMTSRASDGDDLAELLGDVQHRLGELDTQPSGPQTLGLAELLALPPPTWILDKILPEAGLALLAAWPKVGKSLLAQDWTMRMVHGVDRWHERRLTPGPVLYLAGEGLRSMKIRASAWIAAHPHAQVRHPLAVGRLPLLSDPQGMADMERLIAEHRPALTVIDTLNLALGDIKENDAGETGPVMSALSRIRDKHGCSILSIHHLNKGDPDAPLLQRVRGSGAIVAAMDAIIGLTEDEEGAIRLETVMRDAESGKLPIRLAVAPIGLEDGNTSVHLVAAGETKTTDPQAQEEAERQAKQEEAERRVDLAVQVLREQLGGKTSSKDAITTRMGGKATLARAAVATAIDRGHIVQEGTTRDATYRLPDPSQCARADSPDLYRDGGRRSRPRPRPKAKGRRGTTRDERDDERGSEVPGTGGPGVPLRTRGRAPR